MALLINVDADFTQLITVAAAGTPVQGPAKSNAGGWMLKSDPDNTDTVWFMFHGETKATKGFPLNVGEAMVVVVEDLSSLDFDADVNGNKIRAVKI